MSNWIQLFFKNKFCIKKMSNLTWGSIIFSRIRRKNVEIYFKSRNIYMPNLKLKHVVETLMEDDCY